MKISVIVACKNEKDTISKTIESVLNQTYKDYEIIVLDGASSDGTLDILKKYCDRIMLVEKQTDGIYQSMNKGIEKSSGDVLYFLNANDSLYSNDIFEEVNKIFEAKNCDLIYGDTNFQSIDEKGEVQNCVMSHKDFYSKFVWAYRNLNHQSIFYKKTLFENYGDYNTDFKILSDIDFTTRVAVKKEVKIHYFPNIISNYNSQGFSTTSDAENFKKIQEEKFLITKKYLPFEYALFQIYNFLFIPPWAPAINEKIKAKYGITQIYKIRDFKRVLGRVFIWWMRKI